MAHSFPAAAGEPDPTQVRAELERILASELFVRSDRLSAFLRFIVDATLKGGGATLKEHVIAVELYGKGADFNTAADPIVRVDARRLRDKLREFYAAAPPGDVVISMPKGSYTPLFEPAHGSLSVPPSSRVSAVGGEPAATVARPLAGRRLGMTVVAAALGGGLVWLVTSFAGRPASELPSRLLTVTSFPGVEEDPSLSPDGNFVAFSSRGPNPGADDDIWVKPVEGDSLRRLTETQDALEKWPSWSPDGRHITFTRLS